MQVEDKTENFWSTIMLITQQLLQLDEVTDNTECEKISRTNDYQKVDIIIYIHKYNNNWTHDKISRVLFMSTVEKSNEQS